MGSPNVHPDRPSAISLIGMPGAGKSTVGVCLAKLLGRDFVDTDVLIQLQEQQTLQQIVDLRGFMILRRIEENAILGLNCTHHVIATGGSAVYSREAVAYLKTLGPVVFLNVTLADLHRRVVGLRNRGIAAAQGVTMIELFRERVPLYLHAADIIIDCGLMNQEQVADRVAEACALRYHETLA
jgi:shikimate kinase